MTSNQIMKFPDGFLWGTATSAHQVEGNNIYSDWWEWEKSEERIKSLRQEGKETNEFVSGDACDHYHRLEEDFDLVKQGGQNAHRLSIEWARIEPREGEWDAREIAHYRKVLGALRQRSIKSFVTLWHFTNPMWFAAKGGWLRGSNVAYFNRYCEKVARELGDIVDAWITINEPGVYAQLSYRGGWWPPQKHSLAQAARVFWNLAHAHRMAYRYLKSITPAISVGIANNASSIESYRKHHLWDHVLEWGSLIIANHLFYRLSGPATHDFLGVNYYFKTRLRRSQGKIMPQIDNIERHGRDASIVGWEIHPHGLFDVLMDLSHLNKPIYITENGIAGDDDAQRQQFIIEHIKEVRHAITAGADVRGYFYWSLLDNFEWQSGWAPKFGIVDVNRQTFERNPKESYYLYKKIAESNDIDTSMSSVLDTGSKNKK